MLLVSASVGLGLALSTRLGQRPGSASRLKVLHEAVALISLVAIAGHGLLLVGDHFLHPTLAQVTVPFLLDTHRFWNGIGVIAGWLAVVFALSFYVRKQIGVKLWRKLRRWTIVVFALGIGHTIGSGTDARAAWLIAMLALAAVPVVLIGSLRLAGRERSVRIPSTAPRARREPRSPAAPRDLPEPIGCAAMALQLASIGSEYQDRIVDKGDQPVLFMLIAFGVTFGLTRFITHSIRTHRFSWLGNVEAGDTHIHHLVWGIALLLLSGLVEIALQPPLELTAILFGVGAALTLDEFALWLHLEDVYWSEQGRQSIDAVIVFAIVSGFMVIGAYPMGIGDSAQPGDFASIATSIVFGLALAFVCFRKGKLMWGVVGIYVTPIAIIGAMRLARPTSTWAKRRYGERKLARSRERYGGEEKAHPPPPPSELGAARSIGAEREGERTEVDG